MCPDTSRSSYRPQRKGGLASVAFARDIIFATKTISCEYINFAKYIISTLSTVLLERLERGIGDGMHAQERDLKQEIESILDSLEEYHTQWICIWGTCNPEKSVSCD